VIGEDRFLISVRNANQLLVVERGQGVVEVINEDTDDSDDSSCAKGRQLADFDDDGDVRCGDPSVMNHQHNPQWLGDGRVLVADSENDRVVELRRTDSGWEPAWTLTEAGGLRLQWPRDADRLSNGNTLVTDSLNRRVFEVTPGGEVVWSYATPLIPYEADPMPAGEVAGGYGSPSTASETDGTATTLPAVTPPPTNGTPPNDGRTTTATAAPRTEGGSAAETPPATTERGRPGETGISADDIPGLSLLLVGVKAVFPRLPIWFGEFQLLVTLCSVGLVVVGLVDHRRG
jgi:hypothetical protein